MITILCTYNRTIKKDEKTGYTNFSVFTNAPGVPTNEHGALLCSGIIPAFPVKLPLELTGEIKTFGKYKVFVISSYLIKTPNEAATISFLSNKTFENIGEKTAREIVQTIGADIFNFVQQENALEVLSAIPHIGEKTAKALINKVKTVLHLQEIIAYITSVGGNYYSALEIYEKHGAYSMQVMKNNPYVLRYAGLSFYTCEAIAKQNNFEECDPRRLQAIVEDAIYKNRQSGHTRISFHELCKKIHGIEQYANMGYYSDPLFIGVEVLSKKYRIVSEDDELYIYLKSDYDNEKIIATEIKRLLSSVTSLSDNHYSITDIEKICNIVYESHQKEAFKFLKTTGIKIITGGPGTGKTSILNGLLKKYELEHPHNKICLCAPTGCAAKRMSEATKRDALTIHRLLEVKPYEEGGATFNAANQLDADCIVIDEASMLDTQMLATLLKAIKSNALVIFLGDRNQLPSVEPGNILHDLLQCEFIEKCILEKVFRQNEKSSIVINSTKIKNGITDLITDESTEIKVFASEDALKNAALEYMKIHFDISKPDKIKLYTPTRKTKFATGSINLNKEFKTLLTPSSSADIYFGGYAYNTGDLVIFTKNNYEKGYFNGDEGIIIDIQDHGVSKHVTIKTDSASIPLTGKLLDDFEPAYALTTHKSQGCECDEAVIIVPQEPASLLERSLIYVAATRAKKKNLFLVEGNALEKAIKNHKALIRNTGLICKLS